MVFQQCLTGTSWFQLAGKDQDTVPMAVAGKGRWKGMGILTGSARTIKHISLCCVFCWQEYWGQFTSLTSAAFYASLDESTTTKNIFLGDKVEDKDTAYLL